MSVSYKRELRVKTVYNILLYAVFISFALALSNVKFLSEIFMGLRWFILFIFLLFGLFVDKWKINKKNITISVALYFVYLCILTFSTINFTGLVLDSFIWLSPFYLSLLIPLLFNAGKDLIVNSYIKFSIIFLITLLPFLFFPASYPGGRFAGWMQNTNMVAGFSVVGCSFIFLKYIYGDKEKKYIIAFVCFFIIILLTQSRGALITTILTVLLGLIINLKNKRNIIYLVLMGLLGFLFYINLNIKEVGSDDSKGVLTVRKIEIGSREEKIQRQLESFNYSPIYGVGAVADENNNKSRFQAESSYTEILAMSGILGFLVFCTIIFVNFIRRDTYKLYLIPLLLLSISEGYLTGIGSVISILCYLFLLKD